MPKTVGDYVAIVKYSGEKGTDGYVETAKGHTADVPTLKFSIVADSLEGAELAAQDEKTGEYTVTDFSYDGATKWSDLKIAIAGKSTNVDFTVYVKGTDKQVAASELIQAGDYTVIAKPTTGDYAGQSFEQDVKVSKLDLSKLGLYIEDRLASAAAPSIADIKFKDGSKFNGLAEQYDLKLTSHSIYQNNTTGTYSYELTVAEGTLTPRSSLRPTSRAKRSSPSTASQRIPPLPGNTTDTTSPMSPTSPSTRPLPPTPSPAPPGPSSPSTSPSSPALTMTSTASPSTSLPASSPGPSRIPKVTW